MNKVLLISLVTIVILFSAFYFSSCTNTRRPDQHSHGTNKYADSVRYFDSVVNATKISDPEYSRSVAERALAWVHINDDPKLNARIYLIAGIALQLNAPDSAYTCYQLALNTAVGSGADSVIPRILYNMAMLYKLANNYQEAITMLDSAQRMAGARQDFITMSNCYNSIGNIEADLFSEDRAVTMFTKALQIAEENNLPIQTGVAITSLSRFEKNESKANQMRQQALKIFVNQPDALEQTGYLLANMGDDCHDPDAAIAYYQQAREIGKKGHIVDLELGCLNNMAYSYSEKENFPAALSLLKDTAIPLAVKVENNSWLATLYDSYAEILHLTGRPEEAYRYQKKALEATTMADQDYASNQVRLLNALLQSRSQEIKILEQSNKLDLQSRNVRLLTFVVVGLAVLAALLILLFVVYRQRKNIRIQRLEIDTARTLSEIEEQEKERLSMQLHDLIRPVKSAISNHIETMEFVEPFAKTELVMVLEKISGSLRQLSHRMNPVIRNNMGFGDLCEGIRQDFSLSSKLSIKMEISPSDLKFTAMSSNHIYFILYELLSNAEKHLGTGNIEISVSSEFDNLYILYKDDGQGFDANRNTTQGLGITLIKKRVLLMGGVTNLQTDNKGGTRWTITLPGKGNILTN
jgi:signal transduction histidine kinase